MYQVGRHAKLHAVVVTRGEFTGVDTVLRHDDAELGCLQYRRAWSEDREAASYRL